MDKKFVKLGDLGGDKEIIVEGLSSKEVARSSSKPGGQDGLSRSVSPAKRRHVCMEKESEGECEKDEVSMLRVVEDRLRKYLFTESNRVSKVTAEFVLSCVAEYEESMIRMIAKDERLCGRLDECEKREKCVCMA